MQDPGCRVGRGWQGFRVRKKGGKGKGMPLPACFGMGMGGVKLEVPGMIMVPGVVLVPGCG